MIMNGTYLTASVRIPQSHATLILIVLIVGLMNRSDRNLRN